MQYKCLLLIVSMLLLSGCSLWPYKSDFDCKIPEGERCKSLYAINKLADLGQYASENYDQFSCEPKSKYNRNKK